MDDVLHILRALLGSADGCEALVSDLYRSLKRTLREYNLEGFKKFLRIHDDIFDEDLLVRENLVVPRTSLELCGTHSTKGGPCHDDLCRGLHFCKFYLLSGLCPHGTSCLFGHSLETKHNRRLLRRHALFGLSLTEMRCLFTLPQSRCDISRPSVCRYYNAHKGCTKGAQCRSLHLCAHYVRGECKFAKHCKRNHHLTDSQVKKTLELFGINTKRPIKNILKEIRKYDTKIDDHDGVRLKSRSPVPLGSEYLNLRSPGRGKDGKDARLSLSMEEEEDRRRNPRYSRFRQERFSPYSRPHGRDSSSRRRRDSRDSPPYPSHYYEPFARNSSPNYRHRDSRGRWYDDQWLKLL